MLKIESMTWDVPTNNSFEVGKEIANEYLARNPSIKQIISFTEKNHLYTIDPPKAYSRVILVYVKECE